MDETTAVSPGNPCPFLRALVAQGHLAGDVQPVSAVDTTIRRVAAAGDGSPSLPGAAIRLIATVSNGLGPGRLLRTRRHGVRLDELRGGPLDKKGAGSGILDQRANLVAAELDRLDGFAGEKRLPDGTTERGLDADDLNRYMDANFARAAGRRRGIDRKLMNGEWPVLLKVLGRDGADGRYLPVADVRRLFAEQALPQRILDRLAAVS
ncbi:hypothetical protein Asp14428_05120 [Actinoplanes sp. NBRC 14428]|uniref:Uncharacterized protein n=1 Tax=Pseudosporangium ferrugineum TaxID=439699 RepID=A0A2T0SHU3_9ACTN|nr:hypothetical protein [Pseudosporangium ferrugineum]PRY32991.1 hypothetical protein CLV70_101151 [Pseudosporangium ferrugineum]BCJ49037.1 hypothetical protein Asp14428_05120 [Actinoplanes sp. NBRC 14428]